MYPEKVNAGRSGDNTNMRRIGQNKEPVQIKFSGKVRIDCTASALSSYLLSIACCWCVQAGSNGWTASMPGLGLLAGQQACPWAACKPVAAPPAAASSRQLILLRFPAAVPQIPAEF